MGCCTASAFLGGGFMGRNVGGGTACEPKPECMTGFLGVGRRPPGLPELRMGGALDTGAAGILVGPEDGGGGLGSLGLRAAASVGAAGTAEGGAFPAAGTVGAADGLASSLGGCLAAAGASAGFSTIFP